MSVYSSVLQGQTVLVGVTGGIAAYKAVEVVSRLKKMGATVHVVMTKAATQFVTPLTFQTIAKNRVIDDMFEEPNYWEVQHISLADQADVVLIVPASANLIGKVANGIADDMLSTTIMATKAPVIFAPAMNVHMYENPIVQLNIQKLTHLGYHFIEPAEGQLACGYAGKGRLAPLEQIIAAVLQVCKPVQDLQGKTILVTAGGTREYLDPVRFIGNPSTGKMGYAVAEVAKARGAQVILVSGVTQLTPPAGVEFVQVESAIEMLDAVMRYFPETDVVIGTAAVADYRPAEVAPQKIKKSNDDLTLHLVRNPDIMQELGRQKGDKLLIGFAAETDNLLQHAQEKIRRKNLDLIVANDLTAPGAGFGTDTNLVKFITRAGEITEFPLKTKKEIAEEIMNFVVQYFQSHAG